MVRVRRSGRHPHAQQPKRKQPKRHIEQKRSFFDSITVKVVAISLAVLVLGAGAAYFMMSNCRFKPPSHPCHLEEPLSFDPETSCSDDASSPCHYAQYPITTPSLYEVPVIPFETYVKGMPHNELWMLETDQTHAFGCKITPPIEEYPFDMCFPNAAMVKMMLDANPSIQPQVFNDHIFQTKGFGFQVGDLTITGGMNPAIRKNYEAALQIIEENVLTETFVDSDILSILNQVHTATVKGLKDSQGDFIQGGRYRDRMATVQPEGNAGNNAALDSLAEEKLGQEGADLFKAIFKRFSFAKDQYALLEKHLPPDEFKKIRSQISTTKDQCQIFQELTPEERKVWDAIFYTPPPPQELPALMEQFANQYREILRENIHPIARAAWVHMQIVKIHPYGDGLGRLARAMMNAELKRGGYAPIVFFDDAVYTQAVQEDDKRPGAFTEFLCRAYDVSLPMNDVPEMPKSMGFL